MAPPAAEQATIKQEDQLMSSCVNCPFFFPVERWMMNDRVLFACPGKRCLITAVLRPIVINDMCIEVRRDAVDFALSERFQYGS